MTNLVLFVLTIGIYFSVGYLLWWKGLGFKHSLKAFGILTILCLPVNINGHVLTIFGNAIGEKGVYSLASLYQKADDNDGSTFALFSSGYQRANGVVTLVGISGYQRADLTLTFCGISGYQRARKHALTIFGFSGYQQAHEGDVVTLIGISLFQRAGIEAATIIGISGYQRAEKKASTVVGLAFYQKVKNQSRAFAVWSPLTADQTVPQK